MLIIDNVAEIKENRVAIPQYHAGHLSLKSSTEVTLALLPPSGDVSSPPMSELIISPVAFASWQYLTEIIAVFKDRPGVVRKLARAVKCAGLNLVYEESASIASGSLHRVEMLADAQDYYGNFSKTSEENSDSIVLPPLERRFIAECFNELAFDGTRPRLNLRPMEGFRRAWKTFKPGVGNEPQRATISRINRQISVELPQSILAHSVATSRRPRAILVSDTSDRLLRVLLPHDNAHFTYIRVIHKDLKGAMAEITDHLSLAFNAILTLLRLKRQTQQNDVELLLYCPEFPSANDQMKRIAIAEHILASRELERFEIEVCYPDRAGETGQNIHKPQLTPGLSMPSTPPGLVQKEDLSKLSTPDILRRRIQTYSEIRNKSIDEAERRDAEVRSNTAKSLLLREQDGPSGPLPIFVSFHFEHDGLYKHSVSGFDAVGLEHRNGKDLEGKSLRMIVPRIKGCFGFIGIWKTKSRGKHKISDWLLWELGVAESEGLPLRIFVHESVAAQHIVGLFGGHLQCTKFEDHNLKQKMDSVLPSFAQEVKAFEREVARKRYLGQTG